LRNPAVRRPAVTATLLAAAGLLAAFPAAGAELRGSLRVVDGKGRPVAESAGEAVVWFQPDRRVAPPAAGRFEMVTRRKRFDPRVLVVPVGSTVRFPNQDPILHNVFSVSGGNAFDLGFYARGDGESHRFGEAGVVRVFCNVHHTMVAYVVVMDTPFFTSPTADGSFRLAGLPAGGGTLFAWHERGEVTRRRVDPRSAGEVAVTVEATRPLVPPHLNKLGRPYARSRRGRY